jgi:hypothetical protein
MAIRYPLTSDLKVVAVPMFQPIAAVWKSFTAS